MNPTVKTNVVIKKQKRMLMLGDWHGASTGFGTVTKNILPHILKHYGDSLHIFFVAINYFGEPYVEGNMTVVSAKNYYTPLLEDGITSAEPNPHGKHAFCMQLLGDKLGFDLVFLIHDIGLLDKNNIFQFLNEAHAYKQQNNLRNFKSVLYTPVDSRLTKEHIRNLHCIDTIITYNKFSRHEIVRNRPELLKRVKTIPHGINPDDFFVMEPAEVKKFREQYFGVENAGKIIFCNINRNQPRKAIGETILAFIEAKEQWPDAHLPPPFLYLHMLEKDPLMSGYDLREIFAQTDLVEGKDYKIAPQEFFTQANGADIATLRAIHNAVDVNITTSTGEGWGLCLDGYSDIIINTGVKLLKDVIPGDYVLSNDGAYNLVVDTTCREVPKYYSIQAQSFMSINVTEEHPFYAIKCPFHTKKNRIEKCAHNHSRVDISCPQNWQKINPSWISVKELEVGDYLGVVKPLGNKPLPKMIDILSFLNEELFEFDDRYIWCKFGFSPHDIAWSYATMCKKYKETKKVLENARKYLKSNETLKASARVVQLAERIKKDGFEINKPNKIKRFIKVDSKLLYAFGWYLAEGSKSCGARIEFDFHIDEMPVAVEIEKIISDRFEIKGVVEQNGKNKCRLRIASKVISNLFEELFGNGALNKKIPEIFNGCEKSLMPLVLGYMLGDGHIDQHISRVHYTTISKSLGYQIASVLHSNDIYCSVKRQKRTQHGKIVNDAYVGQIATQHVKRFCEKTGHTLMWRRDGKDFRHHKTQFIETSAHFFVKIKNIKIINKPLMVYDLCVNNAHSFTANCIMCHNTVTESFACRTPVILPLHTSFTEISNNGERAHTMHNMVPFINQFDQTIRMQTDIFECAEVMIQAAHELCSGESKKMINAAQQYARSLSWKAISDRFVEYFDELM